MPEAIDAIDLKLLRALEKEGRMSWTDLAKQLKLTPPAAADRAARLQAKGVILGYAARVQAESVGLGVTAFIEVTLEHPRARAAFVKSVRGHASVQECHHIAGDHDYLLKVRVRATRDLEQLISGVLKAIPGVARTKTTIVLGTAKETAAVMPC
jgi:Lrp/AsnC family transcriptional regulator, leucine-responsive regulatory protein